MVVSEIKLFFILHGIMFRVELVNLRDLWTTCLYLLFSSGLIVERLGGSWYKEKDSLFV